MNKTEHIMWQDFAGKRLLLVAMLLTLVTHGVVLYFTLPKTYDAFIHMFFADHYARFWFQPWEYRWYTGFLTTSYPPLVHQLIAVLSKVLPMKVAFTVYAIFILEVLIVGIYRFSKLFFGKAVAGVASLLLVVLSSIVQTVHVYGQLPTLTGLALLLNAIPFLYLYLYKQRIIYLVLSLSLLAVTIVSHHVTVIFGMVFFLLPTIFMAVSDRLGPDSSYLPYFRYITQMVRESLRQWFPIVLFGALSVILVLSLIFPYWHWSFTDPIAQVSIPHGSRDNFFEKTSSGLIFYIIPLLPIFALLPAIIYFLLKQRRFTGWAVSFFLCLLLGSGGTTPLPKMILGEHAFNILTLDRFGFWASIIAVPFMARFIYAFICGAVKTYWEGRIGSSGHFLISAIVSVSYLLFVVFIFHLASFRPLQPKEIDIQPILNFLNRDEHVRWRYLTLGFGDQMAWLGANSMAATVDGNYHSARRLPELTTRPIERLENSKYYGETGMACLMDFLAGAEKYQLRYVFSNDRFYDPILYYTGWNRAIRLENGIMVWERRNVSMIPPIQPRALPAGFGYAWGIMPIGISCFAALLSVFYLLFIKEHVYINQMAPENSRYPHSVIYASSLLPILFFALFIAKQTYELLYVKEQKDPVTTVLNYFNHLDFQRFEKAFGMFKPDPAFPMSQYLLEKSVSDGGLYPSYSKLIDISVRELPGRSDTVAVEAASTWRSSLGFIEKTDTFQLLQSNRKWFILPEPFQPEIPEEQVRSYRFTLFKRMGKRRISSFSTVKQDRVKKPFAAFKQINMIKHSESYSIVGELLNADVIPVNVALKATVQYSNGSSKDFFPGTSIQYNLAPKASTFFQLDLDSTAAMDSVGIRSVKIYVETDVSERGYIHGGTLGYSVVNHDDDQMSIQASMYNELTTDINIPGVLIAEKDELGRIWQVRLHAHTNSIRSGVHGFFTIPFEKIQDRAIMINDIPVALVINGQPRKAASAQKDMVAGMNSGIAVQSHCFISNEIYLQ